MITRALLLSVSMLASPAWSQEAPASPPPLSARFFDLANDSIKRFVRDTAAAQSSTATASEEKRIEPKNDDVARFVPLGESPPVEHQPDPATAQALALFLSALVDVLVDELLDVDEYPDQGGWLDSRSRGSLEALRQRAQTPDEYPPSPVRPRR